MSPGDTYSWVFDHKNRLRWGQPAHAFTASEARGMRARFAEQEQQKLASGPTDDDED